MLSGRRYVIPLVVLTLVATGVSAPAGVNVFGHGSRAASAPVDSNAPLRAGAGRADITPPTGYYMMGWVRSDAVATGQHTRLFARVIVLERGPTKVALVAEDLNGIAGGMLKAAADLDKDLGYSERNVLDSASHTHAAPSGYYNFPNFNTVFMTINTPTKYNLTGAIDRQLYTFEVRQLALAIRRADADLAPAALGWGRTKLLGLTANRSLEAHLADYGINEPYGKGKVSQDPGGYADTIDPNVTVLRVDHLVDGRHVPIGIWSTFADHGTVNKFQFHYYNADHHGAATRIVEDTLRREGGDVPAPQDVVAVYGNTDEGDISAGLTRSGPAAADYVGRTEAASFLSAWDAAGQSMTTTPVLEERFTRACFCGQETKDGPVDNRAIFGLSEFTGSEEGRGPLYDLTHVPFEGDHLPVSVGPQGEKFPVTEEGANVPKAVPLIALRIADEMIVSIPGEMTAEMGRRVRVAVARATAGYGVNGVVISGLANEYLDYFTTPEEYQAQHYEGGATVYGTSSSILLEDSLVDLAGRLVRGRPAPTAYPYDARNGVTANAPAFPTGARSAELTRVPAAVVTRLGHPTMSWQGGPKGEDRPLDRAFVAVQRLTAPNVWQDADDDLGLNILWDVDANGVYTAYWEAPLSATPGSYRFQVHANHYELTSPSFLVVPTERLVAATDRHTRVVLRYPKPVLNVDLTDRPAHAAGGAATFVINGTPVVVAGSNGAFVLPVHPGDRIVLAPGAAHDEYGNQNRNALAWTA